MIPNAVTRPGYRNGAVPQQRHSAGIGAKGPRYYDWAWIHTSTSRRHLLIRRNRSTGELAFYLTGVLTPLPLAPGVGVPWFDVRLGAGRASAQYGAFAGQLGVELKAQQNGQVGDP